MLKRAGLLFALSTSLVTAAVSAHASRAAPTNVTVSHNGEETITSKTKANEKIAFTYSKDGVLVRKKKDDWVLLIPILPERHSLTL